MSLARFKIRYNQSNMNKLLKNIGIFGLALVLASLAAPVFADVYQNLSNQPLGLFVDFAWLIGFMFSLPAFLALLFELLGGDSRRIVVAVFFVPFFLFDLVAQDWFALVILVIITSIFFAAGWALRKSWQGRKRGV